MTLRPGWYTRDIPDHVSLNSPGIYEWRIDGVGIYVGKAKRLKSRLDAYPRNVRGIVLGVPWHGQEGRRYRPVHYSLHRAYEDGTVATVGVLEVCEVADLIERERFWIELRRSEAATGGPAVLNATLLAGR